MRELTYNELSAVAAGTMSCSVNVGSSGISISCSGTPSDWRQLLSDAADAVSNFFDSIFG